MMTLITNGQRDAFAKHCGKDTYVKIHGVPNGVQAHKNGVETGKLGRKTNCEEFEQAPVWIAIMTYIAYAILMLFGYLRDFMRHYGLEKSQAFKERGNKVCYKILVLFLWPGSLNLKFSYGVFLKRTICGLNIAAMGEKFMLRLTLYILLC